MPKRAAVLTGDLFMSSQLAGAAAHLDCELTMAGNTERLAELAQLHPLQMVVIDLTHPAAQDVTRLVQTIRNFANAPELIVAYAQHVQTERLKAAREAACDQVTTRGEVLRSLQALLR